jgi:CubicO group peptidase (beta-lactamase class C family)
MKTNSIFWIASMSKPVTSVAAMILVDDGKLDLDAPVARYLPELGNMRVAVEKTDMATGQTEHGLDLPKRPMTVRDLLRHTSGIVYPELDFAFQSGVLRTPPPRPEFGMSICFTAGRTRPHTDATRRWRISFPFWRACRSPISPAKSGNMA